MLVVCGGSVRVLGDHGKTAQLIFHRVSHTTDTRFEVEKFKETENLGLWQTRMKKFVGTTGMLEGVAGCQAS